MAVYRNWKSLEGDILSKVRYCTLDAQQQSLLKLNEYLEFFYTVPEGKWYRPRTDHLKNSGTLGQFTITTNGAMGEIYMDTSVPYTTGTYTTQKVYEEAEKHGSGILGVPHFWENTMTEIHDTVIPNAFGKYFKQ